MNFIKYIVFCIIFSVSSYSFAAFGDKSGNNTGGFGSNDFGVSNNSTGGFSVLTTDGPPSGGPGSDPESPDSTDTEDVPLNGGASILIALGLGIGGRKIYKRLVNA